MAKVLKTAGQVLAIAALIPGPQQPFVQVAAIVANVGAALLAKKPPVQGSLTDITIGANQPSPYPIGRTYYGGNRVHQVGYGDEDHGVVNPYAALVDVYSGMPIQSFESLQADFEALAFSGEGALGWYNTFLHAQSQTGALTASPALTGFHGAIPQWGASYGLSGKAAVLWSLKFDKKGERFSSGVPQLGAIVNGVYGYDPRQDSTWPGGSGACRPLVESTYVAGDAARDPSCAALTYALGRYLNGVKQFGPGLAFDQIVVEDFVEFANVCNLNGWSANGVIKEPTDGGRMANLKRILAAGGGEVCWKGGRLGLNWNAPRVPVGEIGIDDLAEGDPAVPGMLGWRDRVNTMRPEYRAEGQKWSMVPMEGEVQVADWLTDDGEEKADSPQYELVTDPTQAAQLAGYDLFNRREIDGIELVCKPNMRFYHAGDLIELTPKLAEQLGLEDQPEVLIRRREIDPATMLVTFTLRTEDPAKHELVLALTGTAPPDIVLPTSEEQDGAAGGTRPDAPTIDDLDIVVTQDSANGAGGIRIVATVDGPDDEDVTWYLRWRVLGSDSWIELEFTDFPAAATVDLTTDFVPTNTTVELQAAFRSGLGRKSEWSDPSSTISTDILLDDDDAEFLVDDDDAEVLTEG